MANLEQIETSDTSLRSIVYKINLCKLCTLNPRTSEETRANDPIYVQNVGSKPHRISEPRKIKVYVTSKASNLQMCLARGKDPVNVNAENAASVKPIDH